MSKRSDTQIFLRMIKELGNLTPMMFLTIILGVLGYITAAAIPVMSSVVAVGFIGKDVIIPVGIGIAVIAISAVLRGMFRYTEQLSGHYIAFKILGILRNKIFAKLRKLAPAKLDTKEKGNIISVITSDIELMEVFYAHTIAPVMIGIIASLIYSYILFRINIYYGILGVVYYAALGFILPTVFKNKSNKSGQEAREKFGKNNSFLLDSLRGLKEVIFFKNQEKVLQDIQSNSNEYSESLEKIKKGEGLGLSITNLIITTGIFLNLFLGYNLMINSAIEISQLIIALVLFSSSFGPVVALSMLSTTLSTTLASARRVFDILDEEPYVEEIEGSAEVEADNIDFCVVSFSYPNRIEKVVNKCNLSIEGKEKIAIVGKSGCGKSTLVKLLMRYYDVSKGDINIDEYSVDNLPTDTLRDIIGYASQDTFLFNDTIENNIRMGNTDASYQDVVKAAKKASVHDTIMKFENRYKTKAGELGGRLSSGEKQRIALARLFLKDSPILILDEPTSNLDVLNEGEILKSINDYCADKKIIMISHRATTRGICDSIYNMENGRLKKAQ